MSHEYMLYNLLLLDAQLAILLLRTQALDVWTPLFPLDPPFSTKLNYTYLRQTNKFSEIELCGKSGGQPGKGGGGGGVQTHVFKGNKLI